jgi:hypothetical protein
MQVQSTGCAANSAAFRASLLSVLEEVFDVIVPVFNAAYAVVGETCLPDIALPFQSALCLKGESSLDQLDGLFKWNLWAQQEMDVVGHDDEVMQPNLLEVPFEGLQEEARPWFVAKEALAASCLEGDKVGLAGLPEDLSLGPHPFPPGLKPPASLGSLRRG